MSLTDHEVRALYAIAMSYDHRKLSIAALTAWDEQADRGRWTFDEARDAIHEHHCTSIEYLMPAHITAIVRAHRREPQAPREVLQIDTARPAHPSTVRQAIDQVSRALGWTRRGTAAPEPAAGVDPTVVICPHCHAAASRPCTRQVTRGPTRGQHVPLHGSHPSRVDLATAEAAADPTNGAA